MTRASIDTVNRYHRHFARAYPDAFSLAEEYLYILCVNAMAIHSAVRSLGLPGMSDKQQQATWLLEEDVRALCGGDFR